MILFFTKLLLAHLIGDFLLQPNKWVAHKFEKKHKSPYLYWHVFIHFITLCVVLGFDTSLWAYIILITLSHLIIDVIKLNLNAKMNTRWLFFLDQAAHISILAIATFIHYKTVPDLSVLLSGSSILLCTALLFVTVVTSVCMRVIISKWNINDLTTEKNTSLTNAGAYIGVLERLFVFLFIVTNHWEGIGFLIAAKSIFRFGDITEAKNRKLTEYILIGTLLSFAFATIAGVCYNYLKDIVI